MPRILVVDDDVSFRKALVRGLAREGQEIDNVGNGADAIARLDDRQYDVVLTDLRMPVHDGLDVLQKALTIHPCPAIILMSGRATIETAVEVMQAGAFDFVQKPFPIEQLRLKIERALEIRRLRAQLDYLTDRQADPCTFEGIVGANGALRRALGTVAKVARSRSTILIRGETGTGKELIAAAVHHNSDRREQAFVKVNCAALHENLLESELFGHEKGAFTSADRQRIGRFEQADGGTLFLDEIGDMSATVQAKVLRVLQEREFERLGSSRTIKTDVRVLAATNRDLGEMIRTRRFREDLFYRLNVVSIDVPPLRERLEDIPALADYFLRRFARDLKKPAMGIHQDALGLLMRHTWPGNIRELQNVLERATLLSDDAVLGVQDVAITVR
jgi:two-component system response regulator HydG